MLNLDALRNPVYDPTAYNVRDPGIFPRDGGYEIFFSRHDGDWGKAGSWAVGSIFTRDFLTFEGDRDVTPKGYASPGNPVRWGGRLVLPFQVYPGYARLAVAESADGRRWSAPRVIAEEVCKLPWNQFERAIDPTFVVDGDTLHCFFVGSRAKEHNPGHANMLGHAVTRDADMNRWEILTVERPLMGWDTIEQGGVENVEVYRAGGSWIMAASESLGMQRIALWRSADLIAWERLGDIPMPKPAPAWTEGSFGAPAVWQEDGRYYMLVMGVFAGGRTNLALMWSSDGLKWNVLPER